MTTSKRRTEIRLETHEIKLTRRHGPARGYRCSGCGESRQGDDLLATALADTLRLIASGSSHLSDPGVGVPFVCKITFNKETETLTLTASPVEF